MLALLCLVVCLLSPGFSQNYPWEQPAQPKSSTKSTKDILGGGPQPSMGDIRAAIEMFANRQFRHAKLLDDDTFEHLTQSSTGATTGDWLLIFYHDQCTMCLVNKISWDTFSERYSESLNINVGIVHVRKSLRLAVRFKMFDVVPQFYYMRQGIMYNLTYKFQDWDSHGIRDTIEDGSYAELPKIPVPPPLSMFQETRLW